MDLRAALLRRRARQRRPRPSASRPAPTPPAPSPSASPRTAPRRAWSATTPRSPSRRTPRSCWTRTRPGASATSVGTPGRRRRRDPRRRLERRRRLHRLHVLRLGRPALRPAVCRPDRRRSRHRRLELAAQPARGPAHPADAASRWPCGRSRRPAAGPPTRRSRRSTAATGSSTPAAQRHCARRRSRALWPSCPARCDDLTATATALKKAGAAAMVAYAGAGADCAGTVNGAGGLPSLQARPYDAARPAGGPERSRQAGHARRTPATCTTWSGTGPTGSRTAAPSTAPAGRSRPSSSTTTGMGSTSADGLRAVEELIGWVPSRGGVANIGLVRAVHVPVDRDPLRLHRRGVGADGRRAATPSSAASTAGSGRRAGRSPVAARTHDTWFGGPIGSRVSPLFTVDNGAPPPTREGDEMFLSHGRVHRCGRPHGATRTSSATSSTARSTPTTSWSSTCSRRCS